jgi:hypothetical protein
MNTASNLNPIIVVGQPRSGSTILTRVLNESPDLFIINDFYVLQKIDAENLWGKLAPSEAATIASWIYRIIEIRSTQAIGKTLDQSIHLSMADLAKVKCLVQQEWAAGLCWSDVLSDVMAFAAKLAGAKRWGYNTPQDYFHLERLVAAYPDCGVVLQLRQPESVLRSYKNVSGWWHDPRRYNPLTVAWAWRSAATSYEHFQSAFPANILFIRFEDLVSETSATVRRLNEFLDISLKSIQLSNYGNNSSHSIGAPKLVFTDTETLVCESIIGDIQVRLGFEKNADASISLRGLAECARSIGGSLSLFFEKYLFDRDLRKRLVHLFTR